jgi:ectoine hydroxylase-related dioxygenase (phytanoyl-CoA dioxygenase family)
MNLDQLKLELEEYGFVVIHDLIPRAEAERMAKRLMELMDQNLDPNLRNLNLRGVFNYDDQDTLIPLVTKPVCLDLAQHMLGPGFQMCEVGAIWLKPGAKAQGLHADVPIGWFPQAGMSIPSACFVVNCIWMLTDFVKENGATQLIPFSHHSRRVPRGGVEYKHFVTAEGPAGSVVVFHGSIWHRGGANFTTDKHRMGLSAGYFASWMDPAAGGWHLMKRSVRDRQPPLVQQMNRRVVEG